MENAVDPGSSRPRRTLQLAALGLAFLILVAGLAFVAGGIAATPMASPSPTIAPSPSR